ncbi:pimeloyl-ACP methyl ester carboxylesterase [Prauserella sediminis]|uniref:Pimeloyl-ACP methyl ester carboxylesterase n=1 Tax=Prauserella sediminis TaxID=577680 RepID=A0A839Y0K5_9PSEU|nr:alpha/beta hydrolase [Prauserella sediminis]MBB3665485.1 pimeloyl-ACP methyl ester carboxylesterase [Prauserella sediminis]
MIIKVPPTRPRRPFPPSTYWMASLLTATTLGIAMVYRRQPQFQFYEKRGVIPPSEPTEFVLVPGGGHPSSCFHKVTAQLKKHGHNVHAFTLPGVGERAGELTPATGLSTHIDDVVHRLEERDLRDVVLVGHSYAGMVITGVADRVPERIRHLIYLDAVQPRNGQNLLQAQPLATRVTAVTRRSFIRGTEVNMLPTDETIRFLGLTSEDDVSWARRNLTPHPWKAFNEPLRLRSSEIIRTVGSTKIYTHRSASGAYRAGLMTRAERKQAWVAFAAHDLMLTDSELVTEMLINAASNAAGELHQHSR